MEIKGRVHRVFDEVQVTDTFKKREFVVEYAENPQYPELIKLEFIQDRCNLLSDVSEGQEVTVGFNLKGRSWRNQTGDESFFNTIQAWKIDKGQTQQQEDISNFESSASTNQQESVAAGDDSDLPF